MRKALIHTASGRCVNIIMVGDGYAPPTGHDLVNPDDAAIDKRWNGAGFDPVPQADIDEKEREAVKALAPVIRRLAFQLNRRIRLLESKPVETQEQIDKLLRGWLT